MQVSSTCAHVSIKDSPKSNLQPFRFRGPKRAEQGWAIGGGGMTRLFPTLAEKRSSAIMETYFEENYGICSLNEPVTVTVIGHPLLVKSLSSKAAGYGIEILWIESSVFHLKRFPIQYWYKNRKIILKMIFLFSVLPEHADSTIYLQSYYGFYSGYDNI